MIFSCTSSLSGPPLGTADLATVLNELFPCRAKWYNIGIQLRVDMGILDSISVRYDDPGDQLREVICRWLTTSENPTWETMAQALKSPVIGEVQLSMELQQKYCSSGQPPLESDFMLSQIVSLVVGPDFDCSFKVFPLLIVFGWSFNTDCKIDAFHTNHGC